MILPAIRISLLSDRGLARPGRKLKKRASPDQLSSTQHQPVGLQHSLADNRLQITILKGAPGFHVWQLEMRLKIVGGFEDFVCRPLVWIALVSDDVKAQAAGFQARGRHTKS